ncbi:MAG: hypothetical protein DCC49_05095 [Acidobacteria bacterium]|nr:MAG: hypothetical protein DCC49_05095 [Acidobacteriota bacterium]
MSRRSPQTRIRAALIAALPPGCKIDVDQLDPLARTFSVTVRTTGSPHRFVTGWAGEGWPADVKRLAMLAGKIDVVLAHDLSTGAREWLSDHGIGWVDERGRANIAILSGLVVVRDAKPSVSEGSKASWSASTIAVAEAALSGVEPRVASIQHAAGLSRGATAKALAYLEELGLLQHDVARGPGSARRVADANALLDNYSHAVAVQEAKAPVVLMHRLWRDPIDSLGSEIAPALNRSGVDWAVTAGAASVLLAPYLSNVSVLELYLGREVFDDPLALADTIDARVVERGHRIEVRPLPSRITSVAGTQIGDIRCASSARVYADLLAKGGRFAEAANHLKEVLHVGASA